MLETVKRGIKREKVSQRDFHPTISKCLKTLKRESIKKKDTRISKKQQTLGEI